MSFRISRQRRRRRRPSRRTVPALVARPRRAAASPLRTPTLWGPEAEAEAAKRLGWTEAVAVSRPLVAEIVALRDELRRRRRRPHRARRHGRLVARARGHHPHRAASTSPCSTRPSPARCSRALGDRLDASALVVSSKSGSTVETDSQRRAYEQAFRDAGIDPTTRIIVVTDPGSPLDESARAAGYRVFNADPNVGGRYSALTAFGLVPSGLAGVDIAELLDEAETIELSLAIDSRENPGLVLGAAIAGDVSRSATSSASSPTAPTSSASPTGPSSSSPSPPASRAPASCPSCSTPTPPSSTADLPDVQVVRLVDDAGDQIFSRHDTGEIRVSGTPRRAAPRLGVRDRRRRPHPRHQPVRPARRGVGEDRRTRPARRPARARRPPPSSTDGIEVRGTPEVIGASSDLVVGDRRAARGAARRTATSRCRPTSTASRTPSSRAAPRPARGARAAAPSRSAGVRASCTRPASSTRAAPPSACSCRSPQTPAEDLAIPDRPFTFGAAHRRRRPSGDASVLADHGRPVLTLTLTDPAANVATLLDAVG